MDNETEKIFEDQLEKLPSTVVDFISSAKWEEELNEIGSLYNLSEKELSDFEREVTLVLTGLVYPDEFRSTLEQEVGLQGSVLDAVADATEERIFAPIRPALIDYFEKGVGQSESQKSKVKNDTEELPVIIPTPEIRRTLEKEGDIAPENLPTEEGSESFLPPIPLKFGVEGEEAPTHPFEEKMKKVFTAGQQSLGDLAIEPPSQTPSPTEDPKAPPVYHADPYREPIE